MAKPSDQPFVIVNASRTPPCREILDKEIAVNVRINLWDFIILIPNIIFALFLVSRLCAACKQLKASKKPILTTFYVLVWIVAGVGIVRAVVSLFLRLSISWQDDVDKSMWLILRFFLLACELAIVLFGLGFGSTGMGSKSTIRNILIGTSIIALIYSVTQAVLEFLQPDTNYHILEKNYDLYGNGGMIFLSSTSWLFFAVYMVIVILPHTPVAKFYHLPARKGFYVYAGVLAVLNLVQAIGSLLLQKEVAEGLCVVDGTTLAYFTLYAPLLYFTFLRQALSKQPGPSTQFYYPQEDEAADEHSHWSIQTSTPVVPRRKKISDTTSTGLEDSTVTLGPEDGDSSLYNSGMYDDSRGSSLVGGVASADEGAVEAAAGANWLSKYSRLFGTMRADKSLKAPLATPT